MSKHKHRHRSREYRKYELTKRMPEEFDPRNITQAHMDKLAEHLSLFLDFEENCIVIPEDCKDAKKDVEEGIKRVKKLIEKLFDGKIDEIFKDPEEWNFLS